MHNGILTVGGVKSSDYGIYVLDVNDGDMPRRDYTAYSVPGRSRDLHYDNGRYDNIIRMYKCVVLDSAYGKTDAVITDFVGRIMKLKGYQRIESTLHPEHYKIGEFTGELEPVYGKTKNAARIDLQFDCDARKYLIEGEVVITLNAGTTTVYNPGTEDAAPLFTVTGNGSIGIGSKMITISDNPGTMIIDCEIGDAYSQAAHTNYNEYVTLTSTDYSFPVLEPGMNSILVSGLSTCLMVPRWCKL